MQRFWDKVRKGDGCWEWLAKKNNKGYGMFRPGAASLGWETAHRMAYKLERGKIPRGKWVLHSCDNRGCVRPSHLFIGTHLSNMRDMSRKGRQANVKLTPDKVREIRRLRAAGMPRRDVANAFGVAEATIKNVTMQRSWFHV